MRRAASFLLLMRNFERGMMNNKAQGPIPCIPFDLSELQGIERVLWATITFLIENFSGVNFTGANLSNLSFRGSNLRGANISKANLRGTDLTEIDLSGRNLQGLDLSGANLSESDLSEADFSRTTLIGADLTRAILIKTILNDAILTNCHIYGASVWDVQLEREEQSDLVITPSNQSALTVDNLKVAQFIHLLLNNKEIRNTIDTITSKVVLILGNFSHNRKPVLDAIKNVLRKPNKYVPVLFDFNGPESQDLEETIIMLAHMPRFIMTDMTDPRSVPHELRAIIPDLRSVPIQPLIEASQKEYGMFNIYKAYPWVLPLYYYRDEDLTSLLEFLEGKIIQLVEEKAKELKALRER